MWIIGCDYHPSVQQIAWTDTETGECGERRLTHCAEAEAFYRQLKLQGVRARVGIEATGHTRWFERLLAQLGYELWIGNAAAIRAQQIRKQKNDRRDAQHLLHLMLRKDSTGQDAFPRVWAPPPENRDLRQLVLHRHSLVTLRTRVRNQLQALALNEGIRRREALWSKKGKAELISFPLPPWTARRREELLALLSELDPNIEELSGVIEQIGQRMPEVRRLRTHPGVGPITALAFVLVIGDPLRFSCGKQIGSYLGLIPCEQSSADRWRLGHISKQGNALLRHLLGQAALAAVHVDTDWRRRYFQLALRRNAAIAKVALARQLAVRLFWMWRRGWDYAQWKQFGSHGGSSSTPTVCRSSPTF